ncbi:hypothetical protein HMPREF0308_1715 [Corynebacterium striatum ATCC 6940]|nr:hypothetical protein HMPREF0308_1715 [Corynebacterium striatum ATCC 6940]
MIHGVLLGLVLLDCALGETSARGVVRWAKVLPIQRAISS